MCVCVSGQRKLIQLFIISDFYSKRGLNAKRRVLHARLCMHVYIYVYIYKHTYE